MISKYSLAELAKKHQTTELNIRREYIQHLFLSLFYQQTQSNTIFFKGGTALRIIFNSPRFSEGLDFSAALSRGRDIEDAIFATLKEIDREGIYVEIAESKTTSGGYLSDLKFMWGDETLRILLQFSQRSPQDKSEVVTVSNDFILPYVVVLLDRGQLVAEKIQAVLTRSKPRDFYDLYFMIRSRLLSKADIDLLVGGKEKLYSVSINFEQELKQFLPRSHWPVIRDFKTSLKREIDLLI